MRRILIKISFLILLFSVVSLYSTEKLYVFYITIIRPVNLQKELQEACPNLNIIVFGIYSDFVMKVKSQPPDYIITKPEVLKKYQEYKIAAKGFKGKNSTENYVFISKDKKIELNELEGKRIGAVDYLGPRGMRVYLQSLFKENITVKRVIKYEDLAPLVIFNMVDAIFINQGKVEYIQNKLKSKLYITKFRTPDSPYLILSHFHTLALNQYREILFMNY